MVSTQADCERALGVGDRVHDLGQSIVPLQATCGRALKLIGLDDGAMKMVFQPRRPVGGYGKTPARTEDVTDPLSRVYTLRS